MKYQNNKTRIITVRVEMRKTKNEVVWIKKQKQKISHIVIFAMIANYSEGRNEKNKKRSRLDKKNKNRKFAHSDFRYDSENSLS